MKFQDHNLYKSQIIELEPRLPLKKIAFSAQVSYEIEVMITPFIEMQELSYFGHMSISTI